MYRPIGTVCACLSIVAVLNGEVAGLSVVDSPPANSHNQHYASSRAPLQPEPLIRLPLAACGFIGFADHVGRWPCWVVLRRPMRVFRQIPGFLPV